MTVPSFHARTVRKTKITDSNDRNNEEHNSKRAIDKRDSTRRRHSKQHSTTKTHLDGIQMNAMKLIMIPSIDTVQNMIISTITRIEIMQICKWV